MQSFQQVLRTWGGGSLKFDGEGGGLKCAGTSVLMVGVFEKKNRRMAPHAPPASVGNPGIR